MRLPLRASICFETLLRDYPFPVVRLRCWDCDLVRAFRTVDVIEQLGGDVDMFEVMKWAREDCFYADCTPQDEHGPCGGYLPDLSPYGRLRLVEKD